MAKIPEYGVPEVLPEVFRGPKLPTQAPLEAFGGGQETARAFGSAAGVGQDVARFQEQERQKAYNDAVMMQVAEGVNQLSQETTRIKQGLMQVKGKDAQEAQGQVLGDLEKSYLAMDKTYKNEDVKNRLKEHYFQAQQNLDAWSQHYAHQQMEEYDAGEFQAGIKTAIASAAVDPSHGNTAEQSWLQKDAIRKYGERNGKGPEWIKENQDAVNSNIYFTALNALASSGADLHAKDFYEAHKNEMVGNDLIRAENIVKGSSRIGVGQMVADQVMGKNPETIAAAMTEAQKAAGTQWDDPETRKVIEAHVEHAYRQMKVAERENVDNAFEAAAKIVEQTGSTDGIDRNVWMNTLTMQDRERLELRTRQMARQDKIESNPEAITKFYAMSREDMASMSPADMLRLQGALSPSDYKDAVKHWNTARNREDAQTFNIKKEDENRIFDKAREAGLADLTKKDKMENLGKKADAYAEIRNDIVNRIRVEASKGDNKVTQERREQIIDDAIIERRVKDAVTPRWYHYIPLVPQKWINIPSEEKSRIADVITRAGGTVTDERIQMLKLAEGMKASPEELSRIARQTE